MTEEQRGRRPILIATLRAARILAGCFVAHRSKTAAGILPLRFAQPAKLRISASPARTAAIPGTDLVHLVDATYLESKLDQLRPDICDLFALDLDCPSLNGASRATSLPQLASCSFDET